MAGPGPQACISTIRSLLPFLFAVGGVPSLPPLLRSLTKVCSYNITRSALFHQQRLVFEGGVSYRLGSHRIYRFSVVSPPSRVLFPPGSHPSTPARWLTAIPEESSQTQRRWPSEWQASIRDAVLCFGHYRSSICCTRPLFSTAVFAYWCSQATAHFRSQPLTCAASLLFHDCPSPTWARIRFGLRFFSALDFMISATRNNVAHSPSS